MLKNQQQFLSGQRSDWFDYILNIFVKNAVYHDHKRLIQHVNDLGNYL